MSTARDADQPGADEGRDVVTAFLNQLEYSIVAWKQLEVLFEPKNWKLLDQVCMAMRNQFAQLVLAHLVLTVTRLFDPDVQSGRENITLRRVERALAIPVCSKWFRQWSAAVRRLANLEPKCRDLRNRAISHFDRKWATQEYGPTSVTAKEMRPVIHAMEVLFAIGKQKQSGSLVNYSPLVDAGQLMAKVRKGRKLEQLVSSGQVDKVHLRTARDI